MLRYRWFFLWLLMPAVATAQPLKLIVKEGIPPAGSQEEAKQEARHVAGSAEVIDSARWKGTRATTIKDMTDYSPSVFAQPRNGAEASRLSMRGSGLANAFQGRGILLLQDGMPLNKADGEFEFQAIDPWLVDYMEILPGANAMVKGASNFGGAINLTSPTGRTLNGTQIRGEMGGYGHGHGSVATGMMRGDTDIYAAGTYFTQEGYRDQNRQRSGRFSGNLGIRSSDTTEHRFFVAQTLTRAEIPGTLNRAEIADDPQQANPLNAARDYERNLDVTRFGYRHSWRDGSAQWDNTLYWSYRDLDNPVTTYIQSHSNDWGLRSHYQQALGDDRVIFGVNAYYGTNAEKRYANVNGRRGAHILTRDTQALTSEAYAQYEHLLAGSLYGIGSMQVSYAVRELEESVPARQSQQDDYVGVNPRIGLRYDMENGTQFFTNLSRSYEPPTLSELSAGNVPGFAQLNAQKATTWELGARGNFRQVAWQVSYYHGWLKDEFVNYRFADGSTATTNADSTTRDGVELGLSGTVLRLSGGDFVTARGAYQWNRFRLDDDVLYGDNQLPGIPQHIARAELLYHHGTWYVGPNMEWAGGYPVDLTNTVRAPGFAIMGLSAGWDLPMQGLSFYVEGRNLFDRNYIATSNVIPDAAGADGRYYYPGEGRNIYVGFTLQF